ncbi:MAG: LysR family transcriptional regulator, partial [Rhodocyclaceae bacterium]|nr:LysR family transcriptional regulator [Rhodocyclaceae bacterium]
MDIELARTFLAVAATGNFVGAAARLHITQSTVSARIQTLESQMAARLFRRGRGGAELTAAGQRFLRHAKTLVRTLEQARNEVGLPSGFSGMLTLGGRSALWHGFLPNWVGWMREAIPDLALRLEVGFEEAIMEDLMQGTVDIGVMYTPESRPGLAVEHLFDESLVLITSKPDCPWPDPDYIHVDWGPEFLAQFGSRVPGAGTPSRSANIGWIGLPLIEAYGGSAYLPLRTVREALDQDRLWLIDAAPVIALPVHMVFPTDRDEPHLARAVQKLRSLGAEERAR